MQEKYPWLEPDNKRRNMSDREILDKYIDLEKSYQTDYKRNKLWICYTNIKMPSVEEMK